MNRYQYYLTIPILIAALLWLALPDLRPTIDGTCGLLLYGLPVMLSGTLLGRLDQLQQRRVHIHRPSDYWRQVPAGLVLSIATALALSHTYTAVLGRMAAADNLSDMLLYGVCIAAASGVLAVAGVLGWTEATDTQDAQPRVDIVRA